MSTDVVLKMTTILKEMKIAQLCSKSERTLDNWMYTRKIVLFTKVTINTQLLDKRMLSVACLGKQNNYVVIYLCIKLIFQLLFLHLKYIYIPLQIVRI